MIKPDTTTVTITPVTDTRWDARIDKGSTLTIERGGFLTFAEAAEWVKSTL